MTVLDSTGQLLASGDDAANSRLQPFTQHEQSVQPEIETNIDKALAPFLGMDNFRASVTAKLNTDAQQIQETIYDPESKVERSVRDHQGSTEIDAVPKSDTAATVEQNVPQAAPGCRCCRS